MRTIRMEFLQKVFTNDEEMLHMEVEMAIPIMCSLYSLDPFQLAWSYS